MPPRIVPGAAVGAGDSAVLAELTGAGLAPQFWTGAPNEVFGWHTHDGDKILYVVGGALTFRLRDGSAYELVAGDRFELPAGTDHAAAAGVAGCRCIEAYARR